MTMLVKQCAKCGKLIPYGQRYCPQCATTAPAKRQHEYDMYKRDKRADTFYHSAAWQRLQKVIVAQANYMCEDCKAHGIVKPGRVVHHIVPIDTDWSKRLEPSNLIYVCDACHSKRHKKLEKQAKTGVGAAKIV